MEMGNQLEVRTAVFLQNQCPVHTGYEGTSWVSRAGQHSEIRMVMASMMMITAFQILSLNCRGICSSKEKTFICLAG
jgi:hypothetical protein